MYLGTLMCPISSNLVPIFVIKYYENCILWLLWMLFIYTCSLKQPLYQVRRVTDNLSPNKLDFYFTSMFLLTFCRRKLAYLYALTVSVCLLNFLIGHINHGEMSPLFILSLWGQSSDESYDFHLVR